MLFRPEDLDIIAAVDFWLDSAVSPVYHKQPLAQDYARAFKGIEELGEAFAAFLLLTGQNPRKLDQMPATNEAFFAEMADAAWSIIFGIQHFSKDTAFTDQVMRDGLAKAGQRVVSAHRQAAEAAKRENKPTKEELIKRAEEFLAENRGTVERADEEQQGFPGIGAEQ
jgi:hypothetical protein